MLGANWERMAPSPTGPGGAKCPLTCGFVWSG